MACKKEMQPLIDRVLDHEATEEEEQRFFKHLQSCEACSMLYESQEQAVNLVAGLEKHMPSKHFTASIMANLPEKEPEKKKTVVDWFRKHPLLTAAAFFIVLMSGYIFSLWNQPTFEATVQGHGHVIYKGNTVIVPKGETIKGDLIVKNGHAKIDGNVDGNVVLINSDKLLASAGHVTGDIEKVNQIMQWIWYHIKHAVYDLNSLCILQIPGAD